MAESSAVPRYRMTVKRIHHAMSGQEGEPIIVPHEDPHGEWVPIEQVRELAKERDAWKWRCGKFAHALREYAGLYLEEADV